MAYCPLHCSDRLARRGVFVWPVLWSLGSRAKRATTSCQCVRSTPDCVATCQARRARSSAYRMRQTVIPQLFTPTHSSLMTSGGLYEAVPRHVFTTRGATPSRAGIGLGRNPSGPARRVNRHMTRIRSVADSFYSVLNRRPSTQRTAKKCRQSRADGRGFPLLFAPSLTRRTPLHILPVEIGLAPTYLLSLGAARA